MHGTSLFLIKQFRIHWMRVSYIGVSIHRDKAWLTFGKNDNIKMFNTADGTLKIMAAKVDFMAKSLTVSEQKFRCERCKQHIIFQICVQRKNKCLAFFEYATDE